jgi:hypothetical protein
MIVSDEKKFVFIHNYKVAGTSIRSALNKYETPKIGRSKIINRKVAKKIDRGLKKAGIERFSYESHLEAKEAKEILKEDWEKYFTFGFVRNPWSWQVSLYSYMLQTEGHYQHDLIKSMGSFEEYVEWRVEKEKRLQSEFFCNSDGNVIVDFVGRMETLSSDFEKVCKKVGVKERIPHKRSSKHRDYRNYYNERTKKMIKNSFEKDIEKFGYRFDGLKEESKVRREFS